MTGRFARTIEEMARAEVAERARWRAFSRLGPGTAVGAPTIPHRVDPWGRLLAAVEAIPEAEAIA